VILGETSAVRVFVRLKQLQNYLLSKGPRIWFQEWFATNDTTELDDLQKRQDTVAAVRQTGGVVHENRETFALKRDVQYGRRRRHWIYARGAATAMDAHYERWAAYVRLNVDKDLSKIASTAPEKLAQQTFESSL
jgi:hypothetical protein